MGRRVEEGSSSCRVENQKHNYVWMRIIWIRQVQFCPLIYKHCVLCYRYQIAHIQPGTRKRLWCEMQDVQAYNLDVIDSDREHYLGATRLSQAQHFLSTSIVLCQQAILLLRIAQSRRMLVSKRLKEVQHAPRPSIIPRIKVGYSNSMTKYSSPQN